MFSPSARCVNTTNSMRDFVHTDRTLFLEGKFSGPCIILFSVLLSFDFSFSVYRVYFILCMAYTFYS
jgi:hypothetical protein